VLLVSAAGITGLRADPLSRASAAFRQGDYVLAFDELAPLAGAGNARALGLLGFLHEQGYGAPQAYDLAIRLYARGAALGDPFAQARLGLMYDKGHGIAPDPVLAYKWLNLAASRASGEMRSLYARYRDAVASKMSETEIREAQRLAAAWTPERIVPASAAPRHPSRHIAGAPTRE